MATIIIGVLLALSALNGARRGMVKEGTALIGVLLGAILAQGWAAQWARQITKDAENNSHSLSTRVITLGLLIGVALLSGYGSGFLFGRRRDERRKVTLVQRAGGGLLGLINMGLLAAFVLQAIQRLWYEPAAASAAMPSTTPTAAANSWIQATPLTRLLVNQLGLMLLGVAATFAVLSLVVGIIRSIRRPAASTAVPQKQPATAGTATTGTGPVTGTAIVGTATATPRAADATTTRTATTTVATGSGTPIDIFKETPPADWHRTDEPKATPPGAVQSFVEPQRKDGR